MKRVTFVIAVAAILAGTQSLTAQEKHEMHLKASINHAIAVIVPTKGNSVRGTVTFEAVERGVRVVADLTRLTPGKHGFHVHEFGDISSDDGSSAGGHFNPMGMVHSMPMSDKRHAGDMGNIEADEHGIAHLDYVDPAMKLDGDYSIVGRAVIVHEKEDDLKTQPTGNAGPRIGCGVIGIAK
ncbi:MAG: superoxide dismutase family protein [Ignavibacteriales bacterium]|nr:superoxide dismutase family protein [Ignavibacteriales bacterium]